MMCSASDHDEERTLETVPVELLPLHQGLEEDGNCWRATLPLADNLLRRVAAPLPLHIQRAASALPPVLRASALSAPQKRCRHRHTRHCH
jgi:hypothetical protein